MGVLMLLEVLGKSKALRAVLAAEGLDLAVDVVVSLQREFSGEAFPAFRELAFEG